MPWTCTRCKITNWINKTVCYHCGSKRKSSIKKKIQDKNQLRLRLR